MYVGIKQILHHHLTTNDVAKHAAIALVATCLLVAVAYEMGPFNAGRGAPAQIVVHEGDTLWDLAQTYGPRNADPRRTVARIQELNHLTSSVIRPGEVVLIPQS